MKRLLATCAILLITGISHAQNTDTQTRFYAPASAKDELKEAKDYYGVYYRLLNPDLTPYELTGSDSYLLEKVNIAEVLEKRASSEFYRSGLPGTNMILEILPNQTTEQNENN